MKTWPQLLEENDTPEAIERSQQVATEILARLAKKVPWRRRVKKAKTPTKTR